MWSQIGVVRMTPFWLPEFGKLFPRFPMFLKAFGLGMTLEATEGTGMSKLASGPSSTLLPIELPTDGTPVPLPPDGPKGLLLPLNCVLPQLMPPA